MVRPSQESRTEIFELRTGNWVVARWKGIIFKPKVPDACLGVMENGYMCMEYVYKTVIEASGPTLKRANYWIRFSQLCAVSQISNLFQ